MLRQGEMLSRGAEPLIINQCRPAPAKRSRMQAMTSCGAIQQVLVGSRRRGQGRSSKVQAGLISNCT